MSYFRYFLTNQNLRELVIGLMFSVPTGLSLGTQFTPAVGVATGIVIYTLCLIWQSMRELVSVMKVLSLRESSHMAMMQTIHELRILLEEAKRFQAR